MTTKLKVFVTETLTYRREAIVTLPTGMVPTDENINGLLDAVEGRSESADDVMVHLIKSGCSAVSAFDDSLESPDREEVEIVDYEITKEGQGVTAE
ncbi:hypothetical protein J27TS7_08360 [Paenibacillus dendritiformis]|uniref:hypothetical protein n=1 Tax=Paenibacillus dendritiformis TaxID=130049 RepID=UPI001B0B7F36|nr:hypothetical protein [Paenibacillus dendritiformis]GIO71322.1 hypothetical protein J27TS7_08360 [Paenibacillus dendritiformis]